MHVQQAVASVLLILFGLIMIFVIVPAQTAAPQPWGLSGRDLPILLSGIVVVFSVVELIFGLRKGLIKDGEAPMTANLFAHMCKYVAVLVSMIYAWSVVGFFPSSIIALALLMLIGGQRNYKYIIPISLILPGILYITMRFLLRVQVPGI